VPEERPQVIAAHDHLHNGGHAEADRVAGQAESQNRRQPDDREHHELDQRRHEQRPRPVGRAHEDRPVESDLPKPGGQPNRGHQADRRLPLVAQTEFDEVAREQRQPGGERHRPHQRHAIGLLERLGQSIALVGHRAHRGVDRLADDPVDAVRECRDRRRQSDGADAGQANHAVRRQQASLHHEQSGQT
jgi:hypothetical protein